MAAPVTALPQIREPPGPSPLTPEQRYWRTFKSQQLIPSPQSNPVSHISFPVPATGSSATTLRPSVPETFAVTSGSRVQIFSSRTRKVTKTITRFGIDDTAHSGEIRPDGRVVVAGGDSGVVQIFDIASRAILKSWKEHKDKVWLTKWSPTSLTTLLSGSDDYTVKLWDLSNDESSVTFVGHEDRVRSGCFMPGQSAGLVATGSYDRTVRLWDERAPGRAAMTFKHADMIESVLALPSGTTLVAAAKEQISVLDLVAGKPQELMFGHQNSVSSLCLASNGTRLVSGGLDQQVKVWETATWRTVAHSKYPSAILSLAVIPSGTGHEDRHLAVGMASGILSLKTRLAGTQKVAEKEREKEMQALAAGNIEAYDKKAAAKKRLDQREGLTQSMRKRLRGIDYDGTGADIVIEGNEKRRGRKITAWEQALRKVQYSRALDLTLEGPRIDSIAVFTLLHALVHRSALRAALSGRDEESLQPILKFLVRHVSDARHVDLVGRVAMLVLELYAEHLGKSKAVDTLVERLHDKTRGLVDVSQTAVSTRGMLDVVMANSGNG